MVFQTSIPLYTAFPGGQDLSDCSWWTRKATGLRSFYNSLNWDFTSLVILCFIMSCFTKNRMRVLDKEAPNFSCHFHQHLTGIIWVCTGILGHTLLDSLLSKTNTRWCHIRICAFMLQGMVAARKRKAQRKKQPGEDRCCTHVAEECHFHGIQCCPTAYQPQRSFCPPTCRSSTRDSFFKSDYTELLS